MRLNFSQQIDIFTSQDVLYNAINFFNSFSSEINHIIKFILKLLTE